MSNPPAYPDYRHASSIDSDRTASDATIDDHPKHSAAHTGYPPRPYRDDEDDEAQEDALKLQINGDEEEQVGLMQADRDRDGPSSPSARNRLRKRARAARVIPFLAERRGGCLVFFGVLLGFALALPILSWLSSATFSEDSSAIPTKLSSSSSHTSGATKLPKFKASPNDNSSSYALAYAQGFQLDYQVPGWQTVAAASAGTGLPPEKVASFKTQNGNDLMPLDMDTVFGGTLRPQSADFTWSAEDADQGVFTHVDWSNRDIYLEDVTHARREKLGKGKVAPFGGKVLFVEGKDVRDHRGNELSWTSFKISPDLGYVLFFTNEQKQWRHSMHANVWVHSVKDKKTWAIADGPEHPPTVSIAAWAPLRYHAPILAYVQRNNLFVIPRPGERAVQVTFDGDTAIFNAIPDWVYEEEVFGDDTTMWFSPGGTKLVYLRLDEAQVPTYEFPLYNPDKYVAGKTTPYVGTVKMKYPKPGYPNPLVSVHLVDLTEIYDADADAVAKDKNGGSPVSPVRSTRYLLHSPDKVTPAETDEMAHDVDQIIAHGEGARQRLVTEVTWLNDDELVVRETDRASDVMRLVHFDLSSSGNRVGAITSARPASKSGEKGVGEYDLEVEGSVVRRQDARRDKSGWIRAAQTQWSLASHNVTMHTSAYVEVVVSPLGYRHLAFFENAKSDKPIFLTEGTWEIDTLSHVDIKRRKAFFIAGRPSPSQRHLYSVDLPDWTSDKAVAAYRPSEPKALTDTSKPGFFEVDFDPKGAYYVLKYQGPDVPYEKVVGVDDPEWEMELEMNELLREISSQYVRPQSVFYNLTLPLPLPLPLPGDTDRDKGAARGTRVTVSVKETRPHNFDASGARQYPVLVQVYGGPDSQMVDARWDRANWHQYLASALGYIVCTVDGRGTGMRGQEFRASVAGHLGDYEARDVNAAARAFARLPYVDAGKIGVWGWSYGGYLTAKTLERNEKVFDLGVSVAPVTKWEFYDSVYTERYMKLPSTNQAGYFNAGVHVSPGFRGGVGYMLAQGSGDDNVHFSNSAHMLDMLTNAKVRGFRFRMFTDSDHSIGTRGAYRELYEEMTAFLESRWSSQRLE